MRVLLVLATLADIGAGLLFIAVSGFVLYGVNNTGPDSVPTAVAFVTFIVLCFAAPVAAWVLRGRLPDPAIQAIAWMPIAIIAAFTAIGPLFV